jgi:hypothetical protein
VSQVERELCPIRLFRVAACGLALLAAILVAVVVVLGGQGKDSSAATEHAAPAPVRPAKQLGHVSWIIGGAQLEELRRDNAGLARRFFDNGDTFVVGTETAPDMVPKGYKAIPTAGYTSLAKFVSDVDTGKVDPKVAAVIYDPESWSRTPSSEQRAPVAAMRHFTELAGRWGYGAIVAPGRDLALSSPECSKEKGELLDQAYLRCGLTEGAAGAESFVIQAAPVELDTQRLRALLHGARSQLVDVAPEARYFASLSTDPPESEETVWPIDMVRAAKLELAHAPGILLNFTPATVDVAASFLRDLEREGPVNGMIVAEEAQPDLRAATPRPSS